MHRHTILFTSLQLLFLMLWEPVMSQMELSCTFRMTSNVLHEEQQVFITGNLEELGYWNPGKVMMEYEDQNTWIKKISVTGPVTIEYKYTLGSWEKEAADEAGINLGNFNTELTTDTVILNTVAGWTNKQPLEKPGPSILGNTDIYPQMEGIGLRNRDVIVWLPPGYEEDIDRRYPVIYLHDGQNVFDASSSALGTEWRVDESIDSLIRIGKIPPVIAVAIYNTPDRSAEYMPGDTANSYMSFMVNQLKPFMDSTYRTQNEAWNTISCGASAGGTISFMLVWEYPQVFSKAICMSPGLKIYEYDYVREVEQSEVIRENIFLYMDIGGVAIETELRPGIIDMKETLGRKGYIEGKDFIMMEHPDAKHREADWGKRFPEALLHCFEAN